MLEQVTATRFIKKMGNGRTMPSLVECEHDNGDAIEVVMKPSSTMMEGTKNLAIEAIAAMLANDLGLPVPAPHIVELSQDFIEQMADPQLRSQLSSSCALAFGSAHVSRGYVAWPSGAKVPEAACITAAEIFTFDAIIANSDRRPTNPNCLFSGIDFAIFDHELTLCQDQILFWRAPWIEGGFDSIAAIDSHIFSKPKLEKVPLELDRFIQAWEGLNNNRFQEYIDALPDEWKSDMAFLINSRDYLINAKNNIRPIVSNALRALS